MNIIFDGKVINFTNCFLQTADVDLGGIEGGVRVISYEIELFTTNFQNENNSPLLGREKYKTAELRNKRLEELALTLTEDPLRELVNVIAMHGANQGRTRNGEALAFGVKQFDEYIR